MVQFILKVVVPNYWAGTQYRLWIICYWVAETEENVLFLNVFIYNCLLPPAHLLLLNT